MIDRWPNKAQGGDGVCTCSFDAPPLMRLQIICSTLSGSLMWTVLFSNSGICRNTNMERTNEIKRFSGMLNYSLPSPKCCADVTAEREEPEEGRSKKRADALTSSLSPVKEKKILAWVFSFLMEEIHWGGRKWQWYITGKTLQLILTWVTIL